MSKVDINNWNWDKICIQTEEFEEKEMINISLYDMISEMLYCIINEIPYFTYYLKFEDEFLEITECDLLSCRIIVENGDFSDFDWEMTESHIYRESIT